MRLVTVLGLVCLTAAAHANQPATNAPGTEVWSTGAYVYDGAGNVSKIGNNTYRYDSARRMKEYLPEAGGSHAYSYDSFGNVKRIDITPAGGGTPISRIIPIEAASNQISGSGGAMYDRAGNMLLHAGDEFRYDSQNMVVAVEGVGKKFAYVYTADDERIGSYNAIAKQWTWTVRGADGKVLREYASSGGTTGAGAWTWSKDYVYRGAQLLASEGAEGARHYHVDHVGSARVITDAAGVRTAFHSYTPFGEEETSILQDRERLRFTGHERDFIGGLVDENKNYVDSMRARRYKPTIARFMAVDSVLDIKKAAYNPQTWNRYAYAQNRPLSLVDPNGREVRAVFDLSAGTLTVTDVQTRETVTLKGVFSGSGQYKSNPRYAHVKDYGPTPPGKYLIGMGYDKYPGTPGNYWWYRLYGNDGTGKYRFQEPGTLVRDPQGRPVYRDGMNLHTGSGSMGCVTVPSDVDRNDPDYPQSSQYDKLVKLLEKTKPMDYKGSDFKGWLEVKE
jgi:RHS repeat-associated protein